MNKLILAVDDEPIFSKLIKGYLSASGYSVITASSGEEALTLAEKKCPDLIIMDIMMPPGIDGLQTTRKLKENNLTSSIPVIMLTAVTSTDVISEALEAGAVDYIAKPFQAKVLFEKVKRIFES